MSEIRRIALQRLIKKHGSQSALSEKTDISPAVFSQIITGHRNMGEKLARKIERKLGLDANWLDFVGPAQRDHLVEASVEERSVGYEVEIMGNVPLISWVQAGDWHDAVDNHAPGNGDDYLPCPIPHSSNTYAVAVSGESMADVYPEGYIIFVDPNIEPVHGDDVIVRVLPDNTVTFKRYMKDGGKPYLKAMNKDWPNPIIPINGDAEFCGVVIFAGKYPQKNGG